MNYKTLIGLEIHVELSTNSKMFCGCKNEFGSAPNTNVCPICLGHPGALPVMNKKALEYAIMAGLSFNCNIRNSFKMDRKKYFYPDLTKGYQITQQDMPLCENGYIEVHTKDGIKKIGLIRIHIEEDTGKSIHNEEGNTLLDYNRAGVPLIEIVSEPEMSNADEAKEFLENLKETLKFIGISDVKMEQGSLRCDVNINVIDEDSNFKTRITEVKNLNSFKAVYKAINYEEKRHLEMLENKDEGFKETRRWDDASNSTVVMRRKEEGSDYRFSVEGDIPVTIVEDEFIEEIKNNLPELPSQLMKRFIKEYNISEYDADILSRNKYLSKYFEIVTKEVKDPQLVSNWLLSDVLRRVNEAEIEFEEIKMESKNFAKLLNLIKNKDINNNTGKKVLRKLFEDNFDPEEYVKEKGLIQVNDDSVLEKIVDEVLANNQESINDYKNGKDRALGFLVGQCMKASKGKGNPQKFNEMILKKLVR
ncbi:Asp-tRNA(Asn)/Glu-tRNA(Gln) amidotransferase subunit GatB [Miniphocaeibacter halophilus]|uniref:Asp-tRNA(Asn)/Glu-tRNA(Gln) amidotransferase subunit GatB n=1 Tax=Miniphocaeibacter halophilus TaxID=2931922 RepID=A0AC61MQZ6_9FIRM|nr:Asp-tRNA(Asn)/Glu-tRNA(Gln) amidotransferase subunit GatB [Miniphocaeibacter halophilus]QQK07738.1 Asp-tRNA(Asn)/Glu-tRNA(Gln) amidotransferase subunit GatB [Miniphocaeibacter halophilus]